VVVRALVEAWLPLGELNDVSRREAGFIRIPKLSNLHPYLARRPTARISTIAVTLSRNVFSSMYIYATGMRGDM